MKHPFKLNIMKKEELRKVVILSNDYWKTKKDDLGYFHQWSSIGDQTEGIITLAIIELTNGICILVHVGDFKFIEC
jgi:hypothetical protein